MSRVKYILSLVEALLLGATVIKVALAAVTCEEEGQTAEPNDTHAFLEVKRCFTGAVCRNEPESIKYTKMH